MSYDKTCCGTTCDAKANAKYVAKLEKFVRKVASCHEVASYWDDLGHLVSDVVEANQDLIKHAQQNNSTTE